MLISVRALQLKSEKDIRIIPDTLSRQIPVNYGWMLTRITPEELIHLVMEIPEQREQPEDMVNIQYNIQNSWNSLISVINQLVNRLSFLGTSSFTYCDTVYVENMLRSMGIRNPALFLRQVQQVRQTDTQRRKLKMMYSEKEDLQREWRTWLDTNVKEQEIREYLDQKKQKQREYDLQASIYQRLQTADLTERLSKIYQRGGALKMDWQVLYLAEQNQFREQILQEAEKKNFRLLEEVHSFEQRNPYEYVERQSQQITEQSGQVIRQNLYSQMAAAILFYLTDKFFYEKQERNRVSVGHRWIEITEKSCCSAAVSLERFWTFHKEENFDSVFAEHRRKEVFEQYQKEAVCIERLEQRDMAGIIEILREEAVRSEKQKKKYLELRTEELAEEKEKNTGGKTERVLSERPKRELERKKRRTLSRELEKRKKGELHPGQEKIRLRQEEQKQKWESQKRKSLKELECKLKSGKHEGNDRKIRFQKIISWGIKNKESGQKQEEWKSQIGQELTKKRIQKQEENTEKSYLEYHENNIWRQKALESEPMGMEEGWQQDAVQKREVPESVLQSQTVQKGKQRQEKQEQEIQRQEIQRKDTQRHEIQRQDAQYQKIIHQEIKDPELQLLERRPENSGGDYQNQVEILQKKITEEKITEEKIVEAALEELKQKLEEQKEKEKKHRPELLGFQEAKIQKDSMLETEMRWEPETGYPNDREKEEKNADIQKEKKESEMKNYLDRINEENLRRYDIWKERKEQEETRSSRYEPDAEKIQSQALKILFQGEAQDYLYISAEPEEVRKETSKEKRNISWSEFAAMREEVDTNKEDISRIFSEFQYRQQKIQNKEEAEKETLGLVYRQTVPQIMHKDEKEDLKKQHGEGVMKTEQTKISHTTYQEQQSIRQEKEWRQDTIQEQTRQLEQIVEQKVEQKIYQQVNELTDKVYGKLERRLKGEKKRRGY